MTRREQKRSNMIERSNTECTSAKEVMDAFEKTFNELEARCTVAFANGDVEAFNECLDKLNELAKLFKAYLKHKKRALKFGRKAAALEGPDMLTRISLYISSLFMRNAFNQN